MVRLAPNMATAPAEDVDFITCSVCFCEFDSDKRKPKFLQCYHTICLECLQGICKNQYIVCPLCRARTACIKGPDNLTNNFHALYIVDMMKADDNMPVSDVMWCFTCSLAAKLSCLDAHNTIDVPSNKIEDTKRLQESLATCKQKLNNNIQRLQVAQKRLETLQRCVDSINKGINEQLEDNDLKIAHLMSSLDNVERRAINLSALKNKIDEAMKKSDEHFDSETQIFKDEEKTNNIRVRVYLEDADNRKIPTTPQLEHGFSAADCGQDRELLLLSHLVFSILKKGNVPLKHGEPVGDSKQPVRSAPNNSICAQQ